MEITNDNIQTLSEMKKRRSNILTKARIQPFCRANNFNLGYYDGTRVFPRTLTDRTLALYLHKSHFCLIRKSENVSFNQATKELKDNVNIIDNYKTEENGNSHFKFEFIPQKIESHLNNFIVYDVETNDTDRAKPYNMTFYRLSEIAGRYERDPTQEELQMSINEILSFVGDNCVGNALDYSLKFRSEERKVKKNR